MHCRGRPHRVLKAPAAATSTTSSTFRGCVRLEHAPPL
eukprot:COSAG04_NODE_552_length_12696_cov_3.047154_13_plen_37_part_01